MSDLDLSSNSVDFYLYSLNILILSWVLY